MGGEASGGAAEASLGLNARSLRLGDLARHRKWVHLMGPVTLRLHTSVQAKIIQGLQLAKEGCLWRVWHVGVWQGDVPPVSPTCTTCTSTSLQFHPAQQLHPEAIREPLEARAGSPADRAVIRGIILYGSV